MLVRMAAAAVAGSRDEHVTVVRFDEVPDQLPLEPAAEVQSSGDEDFERRMASLKAELDVPVEYGELVSHNTGHAVVNFLEHEEVDLLVMEGRPAGVCSWLLGTDVDWIARHAPCDLLLVDAGDAADIEDVAVVADSGPFDPLKVAVADALAGEIGADVRLVQSIAPDAADERGLTLRDYHRELAELIGQPVESEVVEADGVREVSLAVADAGLVVVAEDDSSVNRAIDGRNPRELLDRLDGRSVVVRPHDERRPGPMGRLLERFAF